MELVNLLTLRIRTRHITYKEPSDLIGYGIGIVVYFILFFLIKKFKPEMNDKVAGIISAIPMVIIILIFIFT